MMYKKKNSNYLFPKSIQTKVKLNKQQLKQARTALNLRRQKVLKSKMNNVKFLWSLKRAKLN